MPASMPVRSASHLALADMEFGDALRDVARGLKITRKEWDNGDVVFLQGGLVHIQIAEDNDALGLTKGVHKFLLSEGDLLATDWITVP